MEIDLYPSKGHYYGVCIYQTSLLCVGCDTRSIFKWYAADLTSGSKTSYPTKTRKPNLIFYG